MLADLFFREGVGVRVNPDLRPERVRWEVEGERAARAAGRRPGGLRLFAGQVADMIIWAPDFRFIWSPRNFDVVRRGGELTLSWRPWHSLRLSGGATYSAVTYDTPGGAQVQYRPRVTYDRHRSVDGRARGPPISAGTASAGAFPTAPAPILVRRSRWPTRASSAAWAKRSSLRADVHDLTDRRAEFLAGYPTPGRSLSLTLTVVVP